MVLTCDDGESPSGMVRLIAVFCNCVLLSAAVTGGLPHLCPSEISERTAPRACRTSGAFGKRRELGSGRSGSPSCRAADQRNEQPWLASPSRAEMSLRLARQGACYAARECVVVAVWPRLPYQTKARSPSERQWSRLRESATGRRLSMRYLPAGWTMSGPPVCGVGT